MIQLKNIFKSYPLGHNQVEVIKDISLTIEAGEFLALMGPSGSGKSTLLHLLGCLDRPTKGEYFFQDKEVFSLSEEERAFFRASCIGFIFQSFNLIPQLTLFQNVELPFLYQSVGISKKERTERIYEALEQVQLFHRLHHLPSQLSGGEGQRAAIARALVIQPLLILADEPTGNLDSKTGEKILDLFHHLHQQGTTLVLVTHDPQVARHCQRIVQIQDGRLFA